MNSRSRTGGGATLLAASVLLVIATLCEVPFLGGSHPDGALFWLFLVTFDLASIGYLVAALLLTVGAGAAISGAAARAGLIAFGVLWAAAQTLYLFGSYLTPSSGLLLVSTILSILMVLGGLLAGIAIGARAALRGAARWSLLVGILVSGITGGIAGTSGDAVVITVLHLISAVGLAVVGLTYVLGRAGKGADVDAR